MANCTESSRFDYQLNLEAIDYVEGSMQTPKFDRNPFLHVSETENMVVRFTFVQLRISLVIDC